MLHETEVDGRTQDVEVKLEGQGPSWTLPGFDDATLLFIPGHTPGHIGLLLSRGTGGALFSGDHLAAHEHLPDTLTGHPDYNWCVRTTRPCRPGLRSVRGRLMGG